MNNRVQEIFKSGLWLYLSLVINNIGGFLYWLIISRVTGSAVVGLTSATVGLASLLIGILSLGIGVGLNHFLGSCLGEGDKGCFRKFFWTAVWFSILVYVSAGGALVTLGTSGASIWGLTAPMLFYAGIIVMLGLAIPIQSSVVATLNTKVNLLSAVLGTAAKIVVGTYLILAGMGFGGAVLGYVLSPATTIVVGLAYLLRFGAGVSLPRLSYLRDLLKGSIVAWVPAALVVTGQWLGVLTVFGSGGRVETGQYYVAFTISNFVVGVGVMTVNLLLPVLSGMSDGRKATASRVLRLGLAIMVPAASFIATYPYLPLSIIGPSYVPASLPLTILLLSSVPLAVHAAVNSLTYSYRRYSGVLFLGLSQNLPRLALYIALVPILGSVGAAISFTVGAYTGLAYAILLAKEMGFQIEWGSIVKTAGVPASLMLLSYLARLPWFIALLLAASSYVLYGRLSVLRRDDLKELAYALLGERLSSRIYSKTRWFVDSIFA